MITNPVLRISKEDLIELIERSYKDLVTPGYEGFEPDLDTFQVEEGQRGDFRGIWIELKPPTKT